MLDVSAFRRRAGARPVIPTLCALALAAIVLSGTSIVDRRLGRAGWYALLAGILLVAAGAIVRGTDRPREWVVLSVVDRAFDGAVFGLLAWTLRESDPAVAAGAMIALAAGFLAAYVRARGGSLGYGIEESVVTPALRYALISLGLVGGWASSAVWIVAVLMLLAAAVRASQVAKEERA